MNNILKIRFDKFDLQDYVLNHYNNTSNDVIFTKIAYERTPKLFREGFIAFATDPVTRKSLDNFPGPAAFSIELKDYNTKDEFIEAYVFETVGQAHPVLHFDLDTRQFLTKD